MYTERLNQSMKGKMSLDEEEKALSTHFHWLDIEEENSYEIPFTNDTKTSKFFLGRNMSKIAKDDEQVSSSKHRGRCT